MNKTPITYSANREIGGSAPSKYLSKIEEKGKVSTSELNQYLQTNWIKVDAIRSDAFDDYFIARAKILLDKISNVMGKAISGRDSEEVVNAFGTDLL